MGIKKKPGAKTEMPVQDDPPDYMPKIVDSEESEPDFAELEHAFRRKLDLLQPIFIPSTEQIDEMSVRTSLGLKSKYDESFWWYYAYATSESYRELVGEYNDRIAALGVPPLVLDPDRPAQVLTQRSSAEEHCHVALIRRGIAEKRISTEFVNAWGRLNLAAGLYHALIHLGKSEEVESRRKFKAGLKSDTIGQRVWYARWLLAHTNNFGKDRGIAEGVLVEICFDMCKARRHLASGGPWKGDWFGKLLGKKNRDELSESFVRIREPEIRRLAGHTRITNDLLPPLVKGAFSPNNP